MIDKGQWGDTGVTPLLFTRNAMGFLMTTEDLGLTSHLKDGAFFIVLCPHHYTGEHTLLVTI